MEQAANERILAQAKALFRVRGYHHTSPDLIMAAANVSKSTFYYHFKSKEDLGRAVVAAYERDYWERRLQPTVADRTRPAGERLRAWFTAAAEAFQERDCRGGCPFAILGLELADADETFRRRLHAIFQSWRAPLAACVADGMASGEFRADLDPETVADLLVAQYEGALLLAVAGKSPESLQVAAAWFPQLLAAPH